MFGGVSHDEVTGWVADLYAPNDDFAALLALVGTAARLKNFADAAMIEYTLRATSRAHRDPTDASSGDDDHASGTDPGADAGAGTPPSGAGTAALLQGASKQSAREAAAAAKRAALCDRAPALGAAHARGEIGSAHLDALARTLGRATAAQQLLLLADITALLDTARRMSPEQFQSHCDRRLRDLSNDDGLDTAARQRRDSYLRTWTDEHTGMINGRFALDPERGKRLCAALDAEVHQLFAEHPDNPEEPTPVLMDRLGAQALCNIASHGHATRRAGADVHLMIDFDTLVHGLHSSSTCELSDGTQIPVGTARRLACDATILPIVLGSTGEVLDMGREVRLANRAQRRALRTMYPTCAIEGCHVGFDRCTIHHVLAWERLGPTDLENLLPLCDRHHHLFHEGGWHLHIDPARNLTMIRPDGEIHRVILFAGTSRTGRRRPARTGPPNQPATRRRPPPGRDESGPDPQPHHDGSAQVTFTVAG